MAGQLLIISRLVARDLRRRPAQAVLMLLAITAATTVLSLALALHGVTSQPYQHTRAATRGPDVVATLGGAAGSVHIPGHAPQNIGVPPLRQVKAEAASLIKAAGVTGHSGPHPVASVILRLGHVAAPVEAEGRAQAPAALDQPDLTAGSWVRPEGIVLERTFAEALGASVGDRVALDGRRYTVAGIAVTAASAPYPNMCFSPGGNCVFDFPASSALSRVSIGLAWVTEPDARALASAAAPLAYVLDLKLKDPATAQQFTSHYIASHFNTGRSLPGSGGLTSWQSIAYNDGLLVQDEQQVLTPGAWLLLLLALGSVAVLAGGRMSEQATRVGLLKAVGASPQQLTSGLVAAQLLPTLPGALLGIPLGIGLFALANGGGTQATVIPPAWWLVAAVLGTMLAVAALAAFPARIGARRPIAPVLTAA